MLHRVTAPDYHKVADKEEVVKPMGLSITYITIFVKPTCELNPKEYLLGYNYINIVKNGILIDFIDNSTAETTSISTINSEEYERERECYSFETLIYKVPTPKTYAPSHKGAIAHSLMAIHKIHNHESPRLLRVLFDSGGARTMIHRRALPNGVNPVRLDKKMRMTTVAGVYDSGREVSLQNIRLP